MSKSASLKNTRKWILFILDLLLLDYLFNSQKIFDSNPPDSEKADNAIKDAYTTKVKNGSYQVQIPSDGVLRAYKEFKSLPVYKVF